MRASIRHFMLLCLMLALPLQGFAAATMLSCALGHGSAPLTVEAAPSCHGEPPASDAPPARHDCTHCAVCLHASALPIPVTLDLPAAVVPSAYAPRPFAIPASHVPDGLERPPRAVPA
ncbi:MAG: hypothetical protein LDL16_01085 [Thiobacillus sp.]|nr:hypothetical protein [Thiobacillus sp.]